MADHEYTDRMHELEAQEVEAVKRQQERARTEAAEEAKKIANEARYQGGRVQAYDLFNVMARVAKVATLKRIKDSKAYKEVEEAGGTWAGFCKFIGFSDRKIDDDIKNLETFGEEFLEASHRLGLGYRDLATIRALPDEARLQITDGRVVNLEKASKKEVRDLVEDLIIKNQQDKDRLEHRAETAEKQLSKAEAKEAAQAKQIGQLEKQLKEAKTGLGENEEQALKTLAGLHNSITGVAAMIQATDPELKVQIRSQAMGLLGYMEALARLTMIELGYELSDGTTPAEVEMARADFERFYGDGDPDLH